jgi:hypothetical protein
LGRPAQRARGLAVDPHRFQDVGDRLLFGHCALGEFLQHRLGSPTRRQRGLSPATFIVTSVEFLSLGAAAVGAKAGMERNVGGGCQGMSEEYGAS